MQNEKNIANILANNQNDLFQGQKKEMALDDLKSLVLFAKLYKTLLESNYDNLLNEIEKETDLKKLSENSQLLRGFVFGLQHSLENVMPKLIPDNTYSSFIAQVTKNNTQDNSLLMEPKSQSSNIIVRDDLLPDNVIKQLYTKTSKDEYETLLAQTLNKFNNMVLGKEETLDNDTLPRPIFNLESIANIIQQTQ